MRAERPLDDFALDLTATTLAPLSLGPELNLELPGRVLAQVHLGWMPDAYANALTNGLEDAGVYDDAVGALVDGAFQGATTWRLGAGWRPFAGAGLELTVSYVHVGVEGSTTTREVMALVSPKLAEQIAAQTSEQIRVNLDSSLHHVMFGAAYRFVIAEHLVLVAQLGYMQAVDAGSELEIESYPQLSRLATPVVDEVLREHYLRHVKIPVVGLGVGYRFF